MKIHRRAVATLPPRPNRCGAADKRSRFAWGIALRWVQCWLTLFGAAALAQNPDAMPVKDAPVWITQGTFFALYVADAQKISEWYVRNLGFRVNYSAELPRSPDMAKAVMLEHDGSFIEILQPRQPTGDVSVDRPRYNDQRLGVAKVGFVVRDLATLEADLTKRGIAFNHRSVNSSATKLRTFAIRDPEGNTIQFFGR